MSIFLDTGNIAEIKRFLKMNIIRGVTTNPTVLFKDEVSGGMEGIKKRSIEIAKLIDPYPLSVEVTTNDREKMMEQALEFHGWAENIIVKIPIHGPAGELENLEVVHELEESHGVHINVTAMMSAQQGFLAAMAGATYVSIFGGRVNNMGYNVCQEIKKLRKVLDSFGLEAKIIIGSSREILNVIEWLEAGAHFVTVVPSLLQGMIIHPYSKETVRTFLDDATRMGVSEEGEGTS